MPSTLELDSLPALATGYALLGSGGGGATRMLELVLKDSPNWPVTLHDVDELDEASPCLAAAFVGSTMLLGERLPGSDPFARLIAAVERWLGHPVPVVCSLEGGGLNGLVPFTLAGDRTIVDADLTGRAVPGLDQMSLLVDRVPGIVVACDTGAGGVAVLQTDRAVDIERVVRAATIQAGGAGGMVFAGFTVGALREHSIVGNTARALELGSAFASAKQLPLPTLASALDGQLLAEGRITALETDTRDAHVTTIAIDGRAGEIHRLVARSENLAFMTDGRLDAAAPDLIVVLDAISRDILEVTDLSMSRHVAVISLPGPRWWSDTPNRLRHVVPSTYGLNELDANG
ncbi:DUF917 domain-containing protein [Microbacterium murale]|uniref:DUF917 family protein n=1 Tax=Microbacterium murale TaxID=1081040 RepID=A0ABU0P740_9MICO|nr:DUF917 domain-containing protein [Microbacterium murale]MDQ0643161.1 DUF917 family protein [Microbacterium murale]